MIDNIRIYKEDDKTYTFADIKYAWYLNVWEKAVKINDVLFIVTSFLGLGEWKSPIIS